MTNERYSDGEESKDKVDNKARIGSGANNKEKKKESRSSLSSKWAG